MTGDGEDRIIEEHEELLAIVGRIRSVPRVRPRAWFRFKVGIYSRMPGLLPEPSRDPGTVAERAHHSGWVHGGFRVAAAVCLILAVAILTFGGLTVAARDTGPGDALYPLKRARESLEMAFTWDESDRAEKNLVIAETRLAELDRLIADNEVDSAKVAEAAGDYAARTSAVGEALKARDLPRAQQVASHLREVKTAGKNIGRRLAAAGVAVNLAPAAGADVVIGYDGAGTPLGDGKKLVAGKTDTNGEISFSCDLEKAPDGSLLQATIEADGRKAVLPVYAPTASGGVKATVEPSVSCLTVGRPAQFTMTLESDGKLLANRSVQLVDTTGTSTVNGLAGPVTLTTDGSGALRFTMVKTSIAAPSRVGLKVLNGAWNDAGLVMAVGGVEGRGSATLGVSALSRGASSAVLDNGIVEVSCDGAGSGVLIRSVMGREVAGRTGALVDPEVAALAKNGDHSFTFEGPTVSGNGSGTASYRIAYEIPCEDGVRRKVYEVSLQRGKPYAVITCTLEPAGAGEVARLSIPEGIGIEVSGNKVPANTSSEPTLLTFQVGAPYAVVEAGGAFGFFACPIDSGSYPDAWALGRGYLGVMVNDTSGVSGMTLALGITDAEGVSRLEASAMECMSSDRETSAETPTEGFVLEAAPRSPAAGRTRITLTIFKEYAKILGD
ncbi:MAG: hypothetical protein KKF41_07445 [Actinobacteria bacterium]|nr:hypothetical protein [Actinomycetota bacterium]MBU1942247.1 hypothetical protein [Actinomycetota bacterium]MBU2687404.1 hypothetical protein [Actinomycetota bacterium]